MTFRAKLEASAERSKSRVILNLDLSQPLDVRLKKALSIVEATKSDIAGVKINHHLILPYGLEGLKGILGLCASEGLPVIADLKMNDIESTNLNIVESLMAYGVDAVIANPFVGKEEGLGKAIETVHSKGGGVILLVYMSHRGAEEGYLMRLEGGEPFYRVFAQRARDWGADGVVVSAKAADKIAETRSIVGKSCLILTPGIGVQGGSANQSLAAGADYVLVGRTITESQDPVAAVRALDEITR